MADEVAARLKQEGFAEENLSYPQQTIARLNAVTSYMIWGLYGATVLFLIASVLLISNAIRLSIFARRKEIEVMKLVGASDGFVRTPFVFEGLIEGLVGAGLAALAVIWINFLFVDWAERRPSLRPDLRRRREHPPRSRPARRRWRRYRGRRQLPLGDALPQKDLGQGMTRSAPSDPGSMTHPCRGGDALCGRPVMIASVPEAADRRAEVNER